MPGQLRSDAACPVCGVPLLGLMDETSADTVKRTFYHDKDPQASRKARRPLPCKQRYTDKAMADRLRRTLEIGRIQ